MIGNYSKQNIFLNIFITEPMGFSQLVLELQIYNEVILRNNINQDEKLKSRNKIIN